LIESLKVVKRSSESAVTDADDRIRRLEAAASDASERADGFAEQAVMLKLELEEHMQLHAEAEMRNKQALKEMEEELHKWQRHASTNNNGNPLTVPPAAISGSSESNDAELQALKDEINALQEEKAALNSDIEEVTTDLTRVQDENEALTAQIEELQATVAAGGGSAAAATSGSDSHTSLPSDLERIAALEAELQSLTDAAAAAEQSHAEQLNATEERAWEELERSNNEARKQIEQLQSDHSAELASKQAEIDSAKASNSIGDANMRSQSDVLMNQLTAIQNELSTANAKHAEERNQHEQQLAALTSKHTDQIALIQSTLTAESNRVKELEAQLTTREAEFTRQLSELTSSHSAKISSYEIVRSGAASALAEQTTRAKQAISAQALLTAQLAEAKQLAAASNGEIDSITTKRMEELNQLVQTLQNKLDANESEHALLTDELTEQTSKLQSTKTALEALQTKSTADTSKLREDISKLQLELSAARAETNTVREETSLQLATAQSEIQSARNNSNSNASSVTAIESQFQVVRDQLLVRESELLELATKYEDLSATYETQSALVASQASELRNIQSQLTVAQNLHAAFETSFQDSETKRVALQTQLTSKPTMTNIPAPTTADTKNTTAANADELIQLRKERAALQAQVAQLQSISSPSSDSHSRKRRESNATPTNDLLSLDDNEQLDGTPIAALSSPLSTTNTSSNGQVSFPSIPVSSTNSASLLLTEKERGEGAQIGALSKSIRSTLDGLRTEVTLKLDASTSQSLQPLVSSLDSDINSSFNLLTSLQQNLSDSTDRELDLMSKLTSLKGNNIRVFCRVRPMLPHELSDETVKEENLLAYPNEQQISIRADVARRNRTQLTDVPKHRGHTNSLPDAAPGEHSSDYSSPQALATYTPFTFDKVFQPQAQQEEVFESVKEMILPVLNGYRACVFAFGQTGSGSVSHTHCMSTRILPSL
jgi:chromosome segregation ATPase